MWEMGYGGRLGKECLGDQLSVWGKLKGDNGYTRISSA